MLRVNCIGAGHWGPNLIRNFMSHPASTVGVVADLDELRLELVQERLPSVEITTSPETAIQDPTADAIVIATPLHTHFELTRMALEAGKHVLVEKPLCPTVEECDELMARARARNVYLAVGHVFLFNSGINKLREIIHDDELGRILYMSATRTNLGPYRQDANALWDLSSHDLSIFEHWLGKAPASVNAHGGHFLSRDIADVVVGSFQYDDGTMASVQASWLNPRKVREITVVGERRMAVWTDLDPSEPVRIYDKSMTLESVDYVDSHGAFLAKARDGDVHIPRVPAGEPLAAQVSHFIESIAAGTPPLNGPEIARSVVGQLEAAQLSLKENGRNVEIPTLAPVAPASTVNA